MRVTLLSSTPDALEVLLFTKNTRLSLDGTGLNAVRAWPEEEKMRELKYMLGTIQSSWEFVDYIFSIQGVTRAFTHQLVRHRVGTAFAQQSQRTVDLSGGFDYLATGEMKEGSAEGRAGNFTRGHLLQTVRGQYDWTMDVIAEQYTRLTRRGVKPEDARGLLPTNILTNIIFKANLRTLHDMALKRLCVKAQGEFQDVMKAITREVTAIHPWAAQMLQVQCAWNGQCAFPNVPVDQCPIKPGVLNPETGRAYNGGEVAPLVAIQARYKETLGV